MAQESPPNVDVLPPEPHTNSPGTFSPKMDAILAAFPGFRTQLIALALNCFNNAVDCFNNAAAAASSAVTAEASAANATAAANVTKWISGATYTEGQGVWSPANFLTYRRKTTGAGATDPSADATNWASLVSQVGVKRSARTSNTILSAADKGNLIDATSGTYSQTFDSAATLGDGWFAYVGNSGTGFITLDPNGAETITVNGSALSTWVLWPNEMGLLVCNGTGFFYYCIQKGSITQTISSPVASLSFSSGLAYRKRMMLSFENVSSSGTVTPRIKVNNSTPLMAGWVGYGGAAVVGNIDIYLPVSDGGSILSGATGGGRLSGQLAICPGDVHTSIHINSRLKNSGGNNEALFGTATYNTTSTSITSIDFVPTSTNIATGTFILTEL